ncbi:MAG: hypothetical protein ACUVUD_00620 [bacterium]
MKLITILLLATIAIAGGSWQQLGPTGAAITSLAPVPGYPNEIYFTVGSFPSLIYHTTDAGLTWGAPETIPDIVTALTVNPHNVRILYAGGKTRRIYKSTNSGETWQVCAYLPITSDLTVQQIEVSPLNSAEVWAVSEVYIGDSVGLFLFITTDAGTTWNGTRVVTSFESHALLLTINPTNPGSGFVGGSLANRTRIFFTTDFGATWHDKSEGLGGRCAYSLAINPTNSSNIICATDTGIYYSSDLGSNWTFRLTGPVYSVAFSTLAPYYVYAGGENLVYRSSDLGWTWRADTTAFFGTNSRWLAPVRPLEVYAGNSYGLYYTTNGGYDWSYRTPTMKHLQVIKLNFSVPDTVFACVEGVGIMKSSVSSQNWQRWGRLFPGSGWINWLAVNPRNPDTIICVTAFDSHLHRTINRGDSWEISNIAPYFQPRGVIYHPSGPDTIYTWGGKRDSISGPLRFCIMRSTDQGHTWSTVICRETGICLGMNFSRYADTIYAYGKINSAPALLISTDRGTNWSNITSGIIGAPITDLKTFSGNSSTLFCTTPAGVFKTENNGITWTNIGVPGATCVLPDTARSTRLWVGTDTQGVFYTINNGVLWDRDTFGITGRTNSFIQRHPLHTYAIYLGVCGYSLAGKNVFGVEELKPSFKNKNGLLIIPTVIKSSAQILVPPDIIRLELYNPAGRLVSAISFNDGLNRVLNWRRPKNLAAGVYLLKAQRTNQLEVAKLLLLP